jgi:hypothetical protein
LMELSVGFTKNPRQLMARARVTSAITAPTKRSFDVVDDIFFQAPKFEAEARR